MWLYFGGLFAQPRIATTHPMSEIMDAQPGVVSPRVARPAENLVRNNVEEVQMESDLLNAEHVNSGGNVPVVENLDAASGNLDGNAVCTDSSDVNIRVGAAPIWPIRRPFNPSSSFTPAVSSRRQSVNGDSYASRAAASARTGLFSVNNVRETSNQYESFVDNVPKRPRSALFTPSRNTSARSVFAALNNAAISPSQINCLQRKMNGECVVTFKSADAKEKFVRLNSIRINSENYAIQDIDRPLTYLTIYDAPFELSDVAIIKRLSPFCDVLHHRRGKFDFMPDVYNGLRHYRVRVQRPIPSFLRFGKIQVLLRYDGQDPTCRRCNLPGHFANECDNIICFNCENLGHEAKNCAAPKLCSICKEDGHLAVNCRYSWISPTVRGSRSDEREQVDIDALSDVSHVTRDSCTWAYEVSDDDDVDDNDDDGDDDENVPLISALDRSFPVHEALREDLDKSLRSPTQGLELELREIPPSDEDTTLNPELHTDSLLVSPPMDVDSSSAVADSTPNADSSMPLSENSCAAEITCPSNTDSLLSTDSLPSTDSPVLDSQGFVKPADPPSTTCPLNDPTKVPIPSSPSTPRNSRRVPASIPPAALSLACLRRPTSPVLVTSTPPAPSPPPAPMEESTADLKRKSLDDPPKDRREKKKRSRQKHK